MLKDPCQFINDEYNDAVKELQTARKELEKIQSLETKETPRDVKVINEKEAIKRVERAKHILEEKRKALKECQEKNKG